MRSTTCPISAVAICSIGVSAVTVIASCAVPISTAKSSAIRSLICTTIPGLIADLNPAASTRTVYRPGGCDDCSNTGYRGHVGVYELFAMDATIREMCFRGASTVKLREQAKASGGLVSLMEDGIRKFLAGDTTIEEVLTVAVSGESVAA